MKSVGHLRKPYEIERERERERGAILFDRQELY
jgi:hypothetical protein